MRPLFEAVKGKTAKHSVDWTGERTHAFTDTKKALASATMLAPSSLDAPIAITTDVTDYPVGAVHEQLDNCAWQPLAFAVKRKEAKRK